MIFYFLFLQESRSDGTALKLLNTKELLATPCESVCNYRTMTWYVYAIAFLYGLLILGSLFGNGGFIVLYSLSRKVRQTVCVLMISLAVADLIFPLIVVPIHLNYLISGTWHQAALDCRLRTFVYLVAASASILSFCCVTAVRYIRIIFPMRYRVIDNFKCNLAAFALLWLYCVGSSSFVFADFLDWSHSPLNETCSHALPKNLFISLFLLTYCVPLTVMLVIYYHISRVSRKHRRRQVFPVSANSTTNVKNRTRSAIHSAKVFMLLFHFVASWLPISVFTLVLKTLYDSELAWPEYTWYLYQYLNLLAFSSSALNPFVYGYSNSHFKAVLKYHIARRFSTTQVSPTAIHSKTFIKQRARPEDYTETHL